MINLNINEIIIINHLNIYNIIINKHIKLNDDVLGYCFNIKSKYHKKNDVLTFEINEEDIQFLECFKIDLTLFIDFLYKNIDLTLLKK